jgi:hypothetical protein
MPGSSDRFLSMFLPGNIVDPQIEEQPVTAEEEPAP